MNAGQYTAPLVRTTTVLAPVINGYSTVRLRALDDPAATTSATDQLVEVTLENTGDTQVTIQLLEMSVYDATGSRDSANLGASKVVKPRGRTVYTVTPVKRYVEVKCTAGGPSNVRVQFSGQIQWQELGFDKIKDDTIYPKSLWQANIPAWGSLSP